MEISTELKNELLAEMIDKMHERMATKMFPPDPDKDDQPAVTAVSPEAMAEDKAVDSDSDVEEMPEDEELEELLKNC